MTPIFWTAVVIDAVLFVVLLVLNLTQQGIADGGREMSLIFGAIIPAIIVVVGVLLFTKTESSASRVLGLIIVAGPGLFLVGARVRSAAIDYQVRRNGEGSGYFSGRELRRAGVAVVNRDTATIASLPPGVDVNTRGRHGMTLMELAFSGSNLPPTNGGASAVDVVRALLARGADPNTGLETATKLEDSTILKTLLNAKARPSFTDDRGGVVIFRWLGVMPLANFTMLLDHGLDVNQLDERSSPLIIEAARNDRWDFVLLLMARAADALRKDRDGMSLADVVQSRVESTSDRPAAMKADIARVNEQLKKLTDRARR